MIYADLHLHSDYSDGTQSLEKVFALLQKKGIQVAAITDHDTLFHFPQVKAVADSYGIRTIRGVEMSCYDFDVKKKVHIIGLYPGGEAAHSEALCREVLAGRDAYHHKLIEMLQEKGFQITYEDAKAFSPHNIVFKMHIFMALLKKYPLMMNPKKYREMFAGKTSEETDKQMNYIEIRQGIEAILADGGTPILAHPCEYDNYDEVEKYVSCGLKGVEISHPLMQEADYERTLALQKQFDLIGSGGSDFHTPLQVKPGKHGLTREQFELLEKRL